jgi:hypothetical protein
LKCRAIFNCSFGTWLQNILANSANFTRHLFQFRPHVMKKILLGVTGVRAEMRGGKAAQAWPAGAAAREI